MEATEDDSTILTDTLPVIPSALLIRSGESIDSHVARHSDIVTDSTAPSEGDGDSLAGDERLIMYPQKRLVKISKMELTEPQFVFEDCSLSNVSRSGSVRNIVDQRPYSSSSSGIMSYTPQAQGSLAASVSTLGRSLNTSSMTSSQKLENLSRSGSNSLSMALSMNKKSDNALNHIPHILLSMYDPFVLNATAKSDLEKRRLNKIKGTAKSTPMIPVNNSFLKKYREQTAQLTVDDPGPIPVGKLGAHVTDSRSLSTTKGNNSYTARRANLASQETASMKSSNAKNLTNQSIVTISSVAGVGVDVVAGTDDSCPHADLHNPYDDEMSTGENSNMSNVSPPTVIQFASVSEDPWNAISRTPPVLLDGKRDSLVSSGGGVTPPIMLDEMMDSLTTTAAGSDDTSDNAGAGIFTANISDSDDRSVELRPYTAEYAHTPDIRSINRPHTTGNASESRTLN